MIFRNILFILIFILEKSCNNQFKNYEAINQLLTKQLLYLSIVLSVERQFFFVWGISY